mgnify:CR=1 FL=1
MSPGEVVETRKLTADELDRLNYIESSRAELRAALEERDGPNCFYCDTELDLENRTIDHVVSQREARRRGWEMDSTHGLGNLRLACKSCNSLKGDRMLDEEGNIPPRPMSRKLKRKIRAMRPEVCKTCMSGRKLALGEVCNVCGIGPQPARTPTFYKRDPRECTHGEAHPLETCWLCFCVNPELRVVDLPDPVV